MDTIQLRYGLPERSPVVTYHKQRTEDGPYWTATIHREFFIEHQNLVHYEDFESWYAWEQIGLMFDDYRIEEPDDMNVTLADRMYE